MSIIRQRKKNLIKAGFIGAAIVFVPFMLFIICLSGILYHKDKELKISQEGVRVEVYQLSHNVKVNDLIKESDVKKVSFKLKDKQPTSNLLLSEIVGKRVKLDLKQSTFLTKDLLYEGSIMKDDLRLHHYNFIKLDNKITVGDYVDVRISFPNGADFLLLSKKKVVDFTTYSPQKNTQNTLWLQVSEEEILRLSSAIVDAYNIGGCSVYTAHYLEETQNAATVTYPVNQVVSDLMDKDPNIVVKATNVLESKLRKELKLEAMYGDKDDDYSRNKENEPYGSLSEESTDSYSNQNYSERNENIKDSEKEKVEFVD